MARLLATAAALAIAAGGCGGDDDEGAATGAATEITVVVDPDGAGGETPEPRTIACDPGSSGAECEFLAEVPIDAFEPTRDGTACTQIFGGPETATITGTVRGERVNARLSRTDGCEIARWDRLAVLLGRR